MTDPPETTTALDATPYAPLPAIREMTQRIISMLPSAKDLGYSGALALAQVAVALQLNPFTGELWAWKNKDGTITLMVGIKGLRRAAHTQARLEGGFYQPHHRLPTEDELQGVTLRKGDFARACTVTVWTRETRPYYEATGHAVEFHGLGICRASERTKMEKVLAARKRAEADALKQAFDLPIAFSIQEGGPPQEILPAVGTNAAKHGHLQLLDDHSGPTPDQENLQTDPTQPRSPSQDWDALFHEAGGNPFEEPD